MALEPQFAVRDDSIAWSTLGWNDWVTWEDSIYPFVPMVDKARWLEPRHMVNVTDRFTRDKRNSLQHAFFNGVGYATMENLWGFWYAMTPHDAEAVQRITRIERAVGDHLVHPEWEPHTPTLQAGVFASRFPGNGQTFWTLVNRNEYAVEGEQLRVPHRAGVRYYDMWRGTELTPEIRGSDATLRFGIDGLGFGAVLATSSARRPGAVRDVLAFMAERSARPLSAYSRDWKPLLQTMVEIRPTAAAAAAPQGMVRIPEGDYDFVVRGIEVEGGNDPGVDVQYPWEDVTAAVSSPSRAHTELLHGSHAGDERGVQAIPGRGGLPSSRRPQLSARLEERHLSRRLGGEAGHLGVNRGCARVRGMGRQAAAARLGVAVRRAVDGRPRVSVGQRVEPERGSRRPIMARMRRPPADVGSYPQGASPFGVLDMEGNVSQWTDEFVDDHTRAAIIRGAASYQPPGSLWYFQQTYRLDEHQKYLLMAPGRDRAGTIGFRCVIDAP